MGFRRLLSPPSLMRRTRPSITRTHEDKGGSLPAQHVQRPLPGELGGRVHTRKQRHHQSQYAQHRSRAICLLLIPPHVLLPAPTQDGHATRPVWWAGARGDFYRRFNCFHKGAVTAQIHAHCDAKTRFYTFLSLWESHFKSQPPALFSVETLWKLQNLLKWQRRWRFYHQKSDSGSLTFFFWHTLRAVFAPLCHFPFVSNTCPNGPSWGGTSFCQGEKTQGVCRVLRREGGGWGVVREEDERDGSVGKSAEVWTHLRVKSRARCEEWHLNRHAQTEGRQTGPGEKLRE